VHCRPFRYDQRDGQDWPGFFAGLRIVALSRLSEVHHAHFPRLTFPPAKPPESGILCADNKKNRSADGRWRMAAAAKPAEAQLWARSIFVSVRFHFQFPFG
jgi:hypothetical protein